MRQNIKRKGYQDCFKSLGTGTPKLEYYDGTSWGNLATESWVQSNAGTVTSLTAGTGLSGGTITTNGTIGMASVGITPGTYFWPNSLNINAQGQVIGANSGLQPFTSLIPGVGISVSAGGGSAQINLVDNGVTPGTYTIPNISVDSTGRVSSISNGTVPIAKLSGYPASSSVFLRGDGFWATPTISSIDINTNTTGQLNLSRLSGYPASSNSFLRGDGTWTLPFINNLSINGTVSLSTYGLTTSGNVNATTGSLIGNNLAAYNSGAIVCLNPLSVGYGMTVSGSATSATATPSYWKVAYGTAPANAQIVSGGASYTSSPAIYTTGDIFINGSGNLVINSSLKTKTILESGFDIESEVLEKFKKLGFHKYQYKDTIEKGNNIIYGVVAEEVKRVLPEAVFDFKQFVPNVLEHAKPIKVRGGYRFALKEDFSIEEKEKVKIFCKNGKSVKTIEASIQSFDNADLVITTEEILPEHCFVYGTFENCPGVSKEYLFEIGLIVLQNSLKRIEALERNSHS